MMNTNIPHGDPMRKPRVSARGFFFIGIMKISRVVSFIDGFNLYHAIDDLHLPYLKWLDLYSLSSVFISPKTEELVKVLYFSSLVIQFDKDTQKRQKDYLDALKLRNVHTILGRFKRKNEKCPLCHKMITKYGEKQTDVNIALQLLHYAYQDKFDRAILITNDSDLVPAISLIRSLFPQKRITTVVPPGRQHSNELIQVSTDKSKITLGHLERCLMDETVYDASKILSVKRPIEYATSAAAAPFSIR